MHPHDSPIFKTLCQEIISSWRKIVIIDLRTEGGLANSRFNIVYFIPACLLPINGGHHKLAFLIHSHWFNNGLTIKIEEELSCQTNPNKTYFLILNIYILYLYHILIIFLIHLFLSFFIEYKYKTVPSIMARVKNVQFVHM